MKTRRIDPFWFFIIAALSVLLALWLEKGASGTTTHLREQWNNYAQKAWWVAGVSVGLWVLLLLVGRWASYYLSRQRQQERLKEGARQEAAKIEKIRLLHEHQLSDARRVSRQ